MLPVGGVQSGPAVSPLLEEDAQLDAVRGELLQHLAGEVIGAVRRPNIRPAGPVRLRPAAGASGFGEPAASAGRQGGQAEQKRRSQTGRPVSLSYPTAVPPLESTRPWRSGRRRLSLLSDAAEGQKVPL